MSHYADCLPPRFASWRASAPLAPAHEAVLELLQGHRLRLGLLVSGWGCLQLPQQRQDASAPPQASDHRRQHDCGLADHRERPVTARCSQGGPFIKRRRARRAASMESVAANCLCVSHFQLAQFCPTNLPFLGHTIKLRDYLGPATPQQSRWHGGRRWRGVRWAGWPEGPRAVASTTSRVSGFYAVSPHATV